MTMGAFGYRLPVQRDMLLLAAIDLAIRPRARSDDELLAWMRSGRLELVHRTGVDFGYDLLAWHEYLMADPELAAEYTFHDDSEFRLYERILAEGQSPRRAQLAESLRAEG